MILLDITQGTAVPSPLQRTQQIFIPLLPIETSHGLLVVVLIKTYLTLILLLAP